MPVLAAEPDRYPLDLFDGSQPGWEDEREWLVLHTRPRQEKSLGRQLHRHRIPFFLPLFARRLRLRSRRLTSYLPLFPGYVFLLATGSERLAALATNRVANVLKVPRPGELFHDLVQVSRLLASGAPVTPEEKLRAGDHVEIRGGPLAGLRGVILRGASGRRFVVQVNFIQQGASVLIEDDCLSPLESPTDGSPVR